MTEAHAEFEDDDALIYRFADDARVLMIRDDEVVETCSWTPGSELIVKDGGVHCDGAFFAPDEDTLTISAVRGATPEGLEAGGTLAWFHEPGDRERPRQLLLITNPRGPVIGALVYRPIPWSPFTPTGPRHSVFRFDGDRVESLDDDEVLETYDLKPPSALRVKDQAKVRFDGQFFVYVQSEPLTVRGHAPHDLGTGGTVDWYLETTVLRELAVLKDGHGTIVAGIVGPDLLESVRTPFMRIKQMLARTFRS